MKKITVKRMSFSKILNCMYTKKGQEVDKTP